MTGIPARTKSTVSTAVGDCQVFSLTEVKFCEMVELPPPLLFTDSLFLEHHTGAHPESAERLRYLHESLKQRPVSACFAAGEIVPAQSGQLELVHDPAYVETV